MLWRYIENDSVPASLGLATDEYLVDALIPAHSDYNHILRLYTYRDHCVVLGRFQDAESEVNLSECKKLGIEVNRRITGGGTIIMGRNQLGVAVIIPPEGVNGSSSPQRVPHKGGRGRCRRHEYNNIPFSTRRIFEDYARGIIKALSLLGIQSEFRPKNDVLVRGKKIAGLAACVQENGNALFHASILLDIDTRLMASVLKIPFEKISDKEITEVEDRLTTVNRECGGRVSIDKLKRFLKIGFENAFQMKLHNVPLTDSEISGIKTLERKRYLTDEWVYQKSLISSKTTAVRKKTKAGMINIYMAVMNNIIKDIIITGDFFSTTEFVSTLERRLRWKAIDREVIAKVIKGTWSFSQDSISELNPEILTDCILEGGNKVGTG